MIKVELDSKAVKTVQKAIGATDASYQVLAIHMMYRLPVDTEVVDAELNYKLKISEDTWNEIKKTYPVIFASLGFDTLPFRQALEIIAQNVASSLNDGVSDVWVIALGLLQLVADRQYTIFDYVETTDPEIILEKMMANILASNFEMFYDSEGGGSYWVFNYISTYSLSLSYQSITPTSFTVLVE